MKIAILDLYEGEPNEGMRGIIEIIERFRSEENLSLSYQIFDVRLKNEIADMSFDAYISSGGPGSPLTSEGSVWEQNYFGLMDAILKHNREHPQQPKPVFLICHSAQIFCRYYGLAKVTKRKSTSFGVMPMHKTKAGEHEPFLRGLSNPFYAIDSRDYQIIQPDLHKIQATGGSILCIEKERPLIPFERAVMALRFNTHIIGTQFHPEADSHGMHLYLLREDKKNMVIGRHGEKKYYQMLQMLNDPDKIKLTQHTVLPKFLRYAMKSHQPQMV
ncbi:MAG: GMP synthase [Bacteroidetes bacterium]|nr:GMP synthase [Bacteroidota bacterium]MBS1539963.1 GMP synthase [Bacteroidota bacterium]